jgi:hypothetical protein
MLPNFNNIRRCILLHQRYSLSSIWFAFCSSRTCKGQHPCACRDLARRQSTGELQLPQQYTSYRPSWANYSNHTTYKPMAIIDACQPCYPTSTARGPTPFQTNWVVILSIWHSWSTTNPIFKIHFGQWMEPKANSNTNGPFGHASKADLYWCSFTTNCAWPCSSSWICRFLVMNRTNERMR